MLWALIWGKTGELLERLKARWKRNCWEYPNPERIELGKKSLEERQWWMGASATVVAAPPQVFAIKDMIGELLSFWANWIKLMSTASWNETGTFPGCQIVVLNWTLQRWAAYHRPNFYLRYPTRLKSLTPWVFVLPLPSPQIFLFLIICFPLFVS